MGTSEAAIIFTDGERAANERSKSEQVLVNAEELVGENIEECTDSGDAISVCCRLAIMRIFCESNTRSGL